MDSSFGSSTEKHNGQLLDLADLDGYLLSLLSTDLAETIRYALLAKNTILEPAEKDSWKETVNTTSDAASWWEDFLAFLTIWVSHGNTPGAKALGFGIPEASQQHQRSSFWRWVERATRGNSTVFRYKILIYGFCRIVLPRLYERMKIKGLEYANAEDDRNSEQQHLSLRLQAIPKQEDNTSISAPDESKEVRNLALQRRKLVVRAILGWMDGMLLPSARLALLLSCWIRNDSGHGGNLSMYMSGLSYQRNTTSPARIATRTMIPLFVVYAHRRWFHREAIELLWNKIGRGLLVVQQETSELRSSVSSLLATEWRMCKVRWSYRLDKLKKPNQVCNDEECALCGTKTIVVPYRLVECCGKVACYVCLWDRLASSKNASLETVSCPVCYQVISRCEPVSCVEEESNEE